ncbi:calcium uptake protein 2, mitochondrial isoform X4 [Egretta garzetta]|uniref:calcium uptake protein 2, mitochondrial isoform X4 n=1 Tax=Egretta garzetta TaxID=188379 RepID=UPI00163C51CE|nr:calcium uptake protein 2, mitochondrial isoform X4 [Egretta garzetta]
MFGEPSSYLHPQGFTRTSHESVTDPRQNITDYSRLNIELQKEDVINVERDERLSLRKHRFMHFASLEYEGEYYMTPRDFLFSVMFDQVERKASAKKLTKKEVDAALLCVAKAKPGPTFFRELGDKGLISYAEYLFLLTILTKPQTGFQIAFKMLDTDGNEQVEKKEFFKLQRIIGKEDDLKTAGDETVFRGADLESSGVNTMLLVHFFGKEGKEKLRYSEFFRWHTENGNHLHLFRQCGADVSQLLCLPSYCPGHRRHTQGEKMVKHAVLHLSPPGARFFGNHSWVIHTRTILRLFFTGHKELDHETEYQITFQTSLGCQEHESKEAAFS